MHGGGEPRHAAPTWAESVYGALATAASAAACLGARAAGTAPDRLAARRGDLPPCGSPLFWFHGASAGEMAAAANLAALLRGAGTSFAAGFTTTNQAGLDWLARRAPAGASVALAPWDAPRLVDRAFERWRPRALFLVETELWPGLILAAARRAVPVLCVSARIYPRDVARYGLARRFFAATFARLGAVLAQDEVERQRFLALGVPAERCVAAGNLKHLGDATEPLEEPRPAEPGLVVCGSIHADEMRGLFSALESVADLGGRFVVAPRHVAAAEAALREAARRGWPAARRSREAAQSGWRVLVLDTMGELARYYARAALAVVGGSFVKHGGHNLVEPVRAGAPLLFGRHCEHCEPDARRLAAVAPEAQVRSWTDLGERLRDCLCDERRRLDLLARQRAALPDAGAIAARYLSILSPLLANAAS
jgi:3-deoxy-D-manno-octulosonic-acid transferase